jgi:hypothetical protein
MDEETLRQDRLNSSLKERVTLYSPDLQTLALKKALLTEMSDALSDLPEDAIRATALLRTIDEHIIPVPASRAFAEHFASLMRSRDRLGRIEVATISNRPPTYNPQPYREDVEDMRRQQAEAKGQSGGGFWSKLFKRR